MADNIFDATLDVDNDVKVNNFDWSHANNLTTQIGRITPIFCDLVPSKTSFRVNPRFGLQFMPMVFPIQTRMKARISFFRYPLRALWKDYKDFIGNFRDGLEEPYINFNTETRLKKMASTGSLGDYLGMPTTMIGAYGNVRTASPENYADTDTTQTPFVVNQSITATTLAQLKTQLSAKDINVVEKTTNPVGSTSHYRATIFDIADVISSSPIDLSISSYGVEIPVDELLTSVYLALYDESGKFVDVFSGSVSQSVKPNTISFPDSSHVLPSNFKGKAVMLFDTNEYPTGFNAPLYSFYVDALYYPADGASASIQELNLTTSPWYNSSSANKNKQQKILAYGFRAYEGIYNSFYRDNRNNPYYLNGEVQYNTWIPTDKGGEDNELYELRYANWEKDFLTTAVQSPQQGNAPLVGITTYTQTVDNHDGTKTELVKTAIVDEDGKKYGLSFKSSSDGLEGVEYVELDNGTAVRQARSLYDLATSGISIPDLRMVNCYQKFLELNMRKGYSYKDIVEGRFAVKVRYADLLLPEFFGGVSRDIDVNSVTQTVDQNVQGQTNDYDKALGSQAGLAGVRGEANANIECFCDEESIIMGILVVTPLPVYTQLLPKHFTYRGLMEHYQPEFNLIGFQPIKYNEVCPIQAYNANKDSLTDTFGYNRPWYEYAQKYDVAHGLFRTDLSNFLMHRVFNQKPELAQSFLTVDPEQVTDVFAVTETTDKIYGQIWFDITCKLPIARVAIPRLD